MFRRRAETAPVLTIQHIEPGRDFLVTRPSQLLDLTGQLLDRAFEATLIGQQRLTKLPHFRVTIEREFGPIDCRKDCLQPVVVGLTDGIKLVGMTAGTLDRDAAERIQRVDDHVVAVEVPGDLAIGF